MQGERTNLKWLFYSIAIAFLIGSFTNFGNTDVGCWSCFMLHASEFEKMLYFNSQGLGIFHLICSFASLIFGLSLKGEEKYEQKEEKRD